MMTKNLRIYTMNKLRDDDTVGKIKDDHIISDFRIRTIERVKDTPWDFVAFGVKEVRRIHNGTETTDRIVGRYNVRLMEERRSEVNPSGLLVAQYSEQQMVGDKETGLLQKSTPRPERARWVRGCRHGSSRPEAIWRSVYRAARSEDRAAGKEVSNMASGVGLRRANRRLRPGLRSGGRLRKKHWWMGPPASFSRKRAQPAPLRHSTGSSRQKGKPKSSR